MPTIDKLRTISACAKQYCTHGHGRTGRTMSYGLVIFPKASSYARVEDHYQTAQEGIKLDMVVTRQAGGKDGMRSI